MQNSTTQPEVFPRTRKELAETMPEIKAIAGEMKKTLTEVTIHNILDDLPFVMLMVHVWKNPRHYGKYRMYRLAGELGVSAAWMYDYVWMASGFMTVNLQEAKQRALEPGQHISYEHLILISKMRKSHKRNEMLLRTLAENWSLEELVMAIDADNQVQEVNDLPYWVHHPEE